VGVRSRGQPRAVADEDRDPSEWTGGDVVSARTALELGFAYAVIPKLELGLRVPLLRQAAPTPASRASTSADAGTSLGDVGVLARYALVEGKTKLGASATITAPTAKEDQFAGYRHRDRRGAVAAVDPAGKRLTLAANGGFLFRGETTDFAKHDPGHQVLFGAGVSVRAAEKLWVIGEGFGRFGLGSDDPTASTPIEATVGIRYRLGQSVALSLGGGTGLRAGIGAPKARGFLMLSFSPRARKDAPLHVYVPPPPRDVGDDDGDDVVNADDQCKLDAEDKDGYQDDDGCPEADNDGDGVLDADDKCPDQPEDKDGVDDGDGCIDGDNDGDGVADDQDKCPGEPEDKDGFEDDDGCDEPDNDNDGVPDVLDQCAMEPETINGNADEDGCPDKGDTLIMVMPDRIEVLEPVTFQGVTTKLSKNAPKALSQIGATLRADRKLKRLRITVHVHPRNNGDEQLSQKRADEIRQWLINWGVEPERLDARGIGSKRPLVPKNQKGADQINDRVEFIIFERQ
jgi:outer membrane protein OmpA-like peptidoglycan-associated protein